MKLSDKIIHRKKPLAIIGLGYVGLPLAYAFSKEVNVIGYDSNPEKIDLYKRGIDPTNEIGNRAIQTTSIEFTSVEASLKDAVFFIIAVPTPINMDKTPDLSPVEEASKLVGRNMRKGTIVVYESTVYPGVTENVCVPILANTSGLQYGRYFKVGYSPERINPGDKINRLETIKKIVSGMDKDSLEEIASIYELIIKAGVHKVSSIKVAEAAKVVENSQRDINIAFMNELSMVFEKMNIDTKEVVEAMKTKWNALGFYPGLVGGHCIGVDPYYFIYEAERLGYHSQIILAGRTLNDSMGNYIADMIIKKLILSDKIVKEASVVLFGISFKENCPDIRNSKVGDIINRLKDYGLIPQVTDPLADKTEVRKKYGIDLLSVEEVKNADCVVFTVAHDDYKCLPEDSIEGFFKAGANKNKVIMDVKGILDREFFLKKGYMFWRL